MSNRVKNKGADLSFTWESWQNEAKTIEKALSSYINIFAWVYTSSDDIKKFSLNAATDHTLITDTGTNNFTFVVDGSETKNMRSGVVKLELRTLETDTNQPDGVFEDSSISDTYFLQDAENKSLA